MSIWFWFWTAYAVIGFLHAMRGYHLVAQVHPEIRDRPISAGITMFAITLAWPLIVAQAIKSYRKRKRDEDLFDE